jgi:hypothetical protein
MIDKTALLIDRLTEYHHREQERRNARRNRLRYLDGLLNRFELLNLRDKTSPTQELTHEVYRLAYADGHAVLLHPLRDLTIAQWQDVLYDMVDPLLIPSPDHDDERPAPGDARTYGAP